MFGAIKKGRPYRAPLEAKRGGGNGISLASLLEGKLESIRGFEMHGLGKPGLGFIQLCLPGTQQFQAVNHNLG